MKIFPLVLLLGILIFLHYSDAKAIKAVCKGRGSNSTNRDRFGTLVFPTWGSVYRGSPLFGLQQAVRALFFGPRIVCYLCEGSGNDTCATNPAVTARKVTCPRNHYCITIWKETLVGLPVMSKTKDFNRNNLEKKQSRGDIDPNDDNEAMNAKTYSPTKKVHIQRGCNTVEFLERTLFTKNKTNNTLPGKEKVYTQLCVDNLCNTGNGRLKCYKCEGSGYNHTCMVKPSRIAEVVSCQPYESCYIETKKMFLSENKSDVNITVSRGCRISSLENDGKTISSYQTMSLDCRYRSLCNGLDANGFFHSVSGGFVFFIITVLLLLIVSFFCCYSLSSNQ